MGGNVQISLEISKEAPKFVKVYAVYALCDVHIRFNCKSSRLCLWLERVVRPYAFSSLSMAESHMSASDQTTDPSASNFTAIFEAASNNYKALTGQDLRRHPLATELESNNNSPDSILAVFRKQAQALDKFRNGDDKLIKSLTPIVNILFTFSTTAGADIGLVSLCYFPYAGSGIPFS